MKDFKHLKTFESFTNDEINEGILGRFIGVRQKSDIEKGLEKGEIEETFEKMFGDKLNQMSVLRPYAVKLGEEGMKDILQLALEDPDGIGTVKVEDKVMVYVPAIEVKYGSNPLGGPSLGDA
jgi:hypothetical protein